MPLDAEVLDWADVILVMEAVHRRRLTRRFGPRLRGKKVVVLGIADDYEFMSPVLVALLRERVASRLPSL